MIWHLQHSFAVCVEEMIFEGFSLSFFLSFYSLLVICESNFLLGLLSYLFFHCRQFDRDVSCLCRFFGKQFGAVVEYPPQLSNVVKTVSLDSVIAASGFSKEENEHLEKVYRSPFLFPLPEIVS